MWKLVALFRVTNTIQSVDPANIISAHRLLKRKISTGKHCCLQHNPSGYMDGAEALEGPSMMCYQLYYVLCGDRLRQRMGRIFLLFKPMAPDISQKASSSACGRERYVAVGP